MGPWNINYLKKGYLLIIKTNLIQIRWIGCYILKNQALEKDADTTLFICLPPPPPPPHPCIVHTYPFGFILYLGGFALINRTGWLGVEHQVIYLLNWAGVGGGGGGGGGEGFSHFVLWTVWLFVFPGIWGNQVPLPLWFLFFFTCPPPSPHAHTCPFSLCIYVGERVSLFLFRELCECVSRQLWWPRTSSTPHIYLHIPF